jgi:tetratricopeptide (TPR) repeat protein
MQQSLKDEVNHLAVTALRKEAAEFSDVARQRLEVGDMQDAAAYFAMSLELYPTAEAHTGLAVTLASRGQWEDAITECHRAIALEPDLGNSYNDIAVYTAELGSIHEALEWLDRALFAPRYDCRHYAHYHRGRLLEQLGRFVEAKNAYAQSAALEPNWEPATIGLRRVQGWLN